MGYLLGEMGAPAIALQPTGAHSTGCDMYKRSRYTDLVTI